eukprot:1145492-Pelagomonas_calceolata.AAC.2
MYKVSYSGRGQMLRLHGFQFCTILAWQMRSRSGPIFNHPFHSTGSGLTQNLPGGRNIGLVPSAKMQKRVWN